MVIAPQRALKNTIDQLSKVGGKIASIAGFASLRSDTAAATATEPRLEPSQIMEKTASLTQMGSLLGYKLVITLAVVDLQLFASF